MKYKALFLDIDGTIVPYHLPIESSVPSKQVTNSIRKASEKLTVCLASGRPYFLLEHILNHLNMTSGYAVINDGAQVIDIGTREILYERLMQKDDMKTVCSVLDRMGIAFFINDNERDIPFTNTYRPYKPYNIFATYRYSEEVIDRAIDELSKIPTIKVNKTHGGSQEKFSVLISHAEATKRHGIYMVGKILGIKRYEIMGVGDSGNDFPLLMASGFKVAMGNAIEDLKSIADYIAPSVDEDGVADVIERFLLKTHNQVTQ